jgi:hypothetical protein
MTGRTPWLVILCRFKDAAGPAPPIANFTALYTAPDLENVVTYWGDITYGALDLSGSEVLGWLTLDQKVSDYRGSGANPGGRNDLVNWAKGKAIAAGADLGRFFGVVVCTFPGVDLFGSAARFVVCAPDSSLTLLAQEVGHGYGLNHSRSVANPTDYNDPFCIMSGLSFGGTNPTFAGRFGQSGPGLCAPYVFVGGWLPEMRIVRVASNGRTPPPVTLTLSPLLERSPRHPQAAVVDFNVPQTATYFIENRARDRWDRGLAQGAVVIHRWPPDRYAYFAGSIATTVGVDAAGRWYADPQFDFSVELLRILDDGSVTVRVAPAGAAGTLSVRAIAGAKLGLAGTFSVENQVGLPPSHSLRERLVSLLAT